MLYDKDIREPLFEFLEDRYSKIRIIEEKQVGKSRADIVMVMEAALVGIEIKSDADTYARLSRQIKDYERFFDFNIIAVGSTHAMHIKEHVPESWGIITIDELETGADFYMYRQMSRNLNANLIEQLSLLWRPELAHMQELNGMYKYKDKSKAFVVNKIIEKVPPEVLKQQMCQELFERDYNIIGKEIRKFKTENGRKKKRKRSRTIA